MTDHSKCPACQQSLAGHRGVTLSVQRGIIIVNGVTAYTFAQEVSLLKLLWESAPDMASYDAIRQHLWGKRGGPLTFRNGITVLTFRLRKATAHTDLRIQTHIGKGLSCHLIERISTNSHKRHVVNAGQAQA